MAEVKWIKIVTDIFSDEKIRFIETMPNGDEIIVIWFKLLCICGKSNNGGFLMITDKLAYTEEMLSSIFGRDIKTIKLALSVFEQLEMIEIVDNKIYISNWEKHQNIEKLDLIREQTRQRVSKHREAKRLEHSKCGNVTVTLDVTECNATDIDIDKELDKENNNKNICSNSFEREEWFKQFWKEYPKKVAKDKAEPLFMKKCTNEETFNAIMKGLREQKKVNNWTKENKQYIPHPTTWLNGGRWKDEIEVETETEHSNGYGLNSLFDVTRG